MLTAVTVILGSEQYRLGLRLTNYLCILTLYSNTIWRNVVDKGRVRLGSIRNKNNWNNAGKHLFGSYSHSGIPGFLFWLFCSQE